MPNRDDLAWFQATFGEEITAATQASPFSRNLLTALAAQETGEVWAILRKTLPREQLLALCVGDTLDEDRGRVAFPRNKQELVAAPQGQAMFDLAHQALVELAKYLPAFAPSANRPDKFCHAYGIFQLDLQLFETDPEFFLQRQWVDFAVCLGRCLRELSAAAGRAGLAGRATLSDLEQVYVAIAYNAGRFIPARGLCQGYFDGTQFYGEKIFALLHLAHTAIPRGKPSPASLEWGTVSFVHEPI